jgi:ubiquinone/menaquinone biosynthesis C-methylase UbiE
MNDLSKIYHERFVTSGLDRRNAVWRSLCRHYFDRFVEPTDRVLDIACGYGEFINNIRAKAKFAIDMNPECASHLDPDVIFFNEAATNLAKIPDNSINVAFSSNFLEHLDSKNDVMLLLREAYRVLAPGGQMIFLGPNIKYAYREYWDFFDHYLPLSESSVSEALTVAGFKLGLVIPRFLPYTMNNNAPTHDLLILAYLRLPIVWRWLGKQFLVVARKPA